MDSPETSKTPTAIDREARAEQERRELRRKQFQRTLLEFVTVVVAGPSTAAGTTGLDPWKNRVDELAGQLFDQASP